MPRILVLNNYPLESAWQEVRQSDTPDQVLFGVNYFPEWGFEMEFAPSQSEAQESLVDRMVTSLGLPIGDLGQQRWALSRLQECDLIYSPCQTQCWKLAFMRAASRQAKPLVCLAHHPIVIGRLGLLRRPYFQAAMKGIDAFPSLSKKVSLEINELAGKQISTPVTWGVDANFYPDNSPLGEGIIATGRTARDFKTFAAAAAKTLVRSTIVCLERDYDPSFSQAGKQLTVMVEPDDMGYKQLIELYGQARAIAIPLYGTQTLHGLQGLMDALGMGKPVLMTKNPLIDLDIEKEGIGIWIEPDDVEGWRQAMERIQEHPGLAADMGKRARHLAETRYASRLFAEEMMQIIERIKPRVNQMPF